MLSSAGSAWAGTERDRIGATTTSAATSGRSSAVTAETTKVRRHSRPRTSACCADPSLDSLAPRRPYSTTWTRTGRPALDTTSAAPKPLGTGPRDTIPVIIRPADLSAVSRRPTEASPASLVFRDCPRVGARRFGKQVEAHCRCRWASAISAVASRRGSYSAGPSEPVISPASVTTYCSDSTSVLRHTQVIDAQLPGRWEECAKRY